MEVNHAQLAKMLDWCYKADPPIPLYIWGATGVGKSMGVAAMAEKWAAREKRGLVHWNEMTKEEKIAAIKDPSEYFIFADIRLSQYDPSDLKGIPKIISDIDASEWHIPLLFKAMGHPKAKGVVFFDEMNLASQSILASCFPAGTKIPTLKGIKNIEDITPGDEVIGRAGFEKVSEVFSRAYEGPVYKIKATNLQPLTATGEHPFFVCTRKYIAGEPILSDPAWVQAKDLTTDHLVAVPTAMGRLETTSLALEHRGNNWPPKAEVKLSLTPEMAEFLGLFVAEGYATEDGHVCLCLGSHETDLGRRAQALIRAAFGFEAISKTRGSSLLVTFNNTPLAKSLRDWCGSGAHNKKIPEFILYNHNKELLLSFLKGYHDGDGCIVKHPDGGGHYVSFATVSEELAQQVQLAFARFGIVMNVNWSEKGPWHVLRGENRIIMGGRSCNIKTCQDEAFDLLGYEARPKARRCMSYYEHADQLFCKIMSIEKNGFSGEVHNFETEKTHTYVAGNILAHNCYQVIHDRQIGEYPINQGIVMLGAGNRAEDRANVFDMPAPLKNRFGHVTLLVPNMKEWTPWAVEHDVDSRILGFLNFKESHLHNFKKAQKEPAFSTPRAWVVVSKLIENLKTLRDVQDAVSMIVGDGTGVEFAAFVKLANKYDIEHLLKHPAEVKKLKETDVRWSVVTSVAEVYRKAKGKKRVGEVVEGVCGVADALDIEFGILLMRLVHRSKKNWLHDFLKSKTWDKVAKKYAKFLSDTEE